MTSLGVSIIIPAHDAATTIAETIESVCSQTFTNWEVIIVDDGSSDETAAIATSFAKQNSRMRVVVSQPQMGVSAARNTGIDLAQFDWLLFLDADDWILPLHLERLTTILSSDPKLDTACCGCVRVTPERQQYGPVMSAPASDLFASLTRYDPMPVHTCIIRRSLVQAVGGFNPALRTCEDWDLFQRIARTGFRLGQTDEVLAHYRIRTNSSSTKALPMLIDGFQVITQGHGPDPRVQNPHFDYANGQPIEDLSSAKLNWACFCAGLAIGSGEDARPLLDLIQDVRNPDLLSISVVRSILYALPLATSPPLAEYHKFWQSLEKPINDFLIALEKHLATTGLVRRARSYMERIILEEAVELRPVTVGITHAVKVEVTEPIQDFFTPSSSERLYCTIELEGEHLGILELPIFEGVVPSCVLADAIAAEFAWPILGRFFEHVVYPDFIIKQEPMGLAIQRGNLRLADGLPKSEQFWTQAHEQVGWTVFLQEIWGCPDWSQDIFYDQQTVQQETTKRQVANTCLKVEVSDELADLEVCGNSLDVVIMIGGVAIGALTIPVQPGIVSAQRLRALILSESGFELCRAAVREALLGRPLTEKVSLRARLAEVTARQHAKDTSEIEASFPDLVAGTAKALSQVLSFKESAVVLGCRTQEAIGTSASRWAMLPTTAIHELTDATLVTDEPLIQISPQPNQKLEKVLYAPNLILRPPMNLWRSAMETTSFDSLKVNKCANPYDRGFFETVFAIYGDGDPWDYKSPYEQIKYEQTLSLLPSRRIERALELACAEGLFTKQLAPLVDKLIAADISHISLERAAKYCTGMENISFMRLDFVKDSLPGTFELIVCSEVLYFLDNQEKLQAVADKFVDALEPGGYLLTAHAHLVVDEPDHTGFNWDHPFGAKVIGETFKSTPGLNLVKEIHTPLYRVQLFQREPHDGFPEGKFLPEVIEMPQPIMPSPDFAQAVLWEGGLPQRTTVASILTHTLELPILMYHRVAPSGSSKMANWRVTPEAFEEQLRYLRDSGFYSITLENWRVAMMARKPLPGRAVIITFDDGYLDFATYAWPLLKRYGFSAMVFLVADLVGQSNAWDSTYGEDLPLLKWEQIKQLQTEGVEFGSHSASHRPLTSLSPTEIVREGSRSRAILERELGKPIRAFAYPHGDVDQVVKHLIGACGYVFGLSCQSGRSSFQDSLLALPRIEVEGFDSLHDFVKKLSPLKD